MRLTPLDATFGVEIDDLNVVSMSNNEWELLYAAFLHYSLVVIRAMPLREDEQLAFTRRFGRLERGLSRRARNLAVADLSNRTADGHLVANDSDHALYLKGNTYWHSDSSYKPVGSKASILVPLELPSSGGETDFADMTAAYDALTEERKQSLAPLEAVHSYAYSQGLVGGSGVLTGEEWQDLPPVTHPVVKRHPETGRKSLYIGRHASHIIGMDTDSGRSLLADLLDDACHPPRLYRHTWVPGDVVIWDNRCTLHRGRVWPANELRYMRRTTVAGEGENSWALQA